MRLSPKYATLCQADCTDAYNSAVEAGETIEYSCHAGLHCFATPVTISNKQLVILGGHAFSATAEYADFLSRYGDLDGVLSGDALKNVKFIDSRDLREAAELVASTAEYHFQTAAQAVRQPRDEAKASPDLLDAHLEIIRLADQLESKNRSIAGLQEFLRGLTTSLDSQKVYPSVLAKFSEIMKAERSSLMVLNEQANELALEAALPALPAAASPIRLKPGEGVAGAVLESGAAMLVKDVETDSARAASAARPVQDKILHQLSHHARPAKGRRNQPDGPRGRLVISIRRPWPARPDSPAPGPDH